MNCCPKCFNDDLASKLAAASGRAGFGVCDACGAQGVELYKVVPESELADRFEDLLDIYTPVANVANGIEHGPAGSLWKMFTSTWDVFSGIGEIGFYKLIKALFPGDNRISSMIENDVTIAPERGTRSLSEFAFFGSRTWDDFADEIKYHHRYSAHIENRSNLDNLLRALTRKIDSTSSPWYRARIWNDKTSNPSEIELYEPGRDKAAEGRMSPKGVCCLYIASSPKTAMAEIRAAVHDEVAVATMRPKIDLQVLDLSRIDRISPFSADVDSAALAANLDNLSRIKEELVRPMRSSDDAVEYVPTQFIADCAKRLGFDGIGYDSVMYTGNNEHGYNIASFCGAKEFFVFEVIERFRIAGIDYSVHRA